MTAEAGAPALVVEGLSVRYGASRPGSGREVLDGVSFAVHAGEIVGLLGPNGVGKSSLVRTVSGVLPGYSGSVRVQGDEVRTLAPRELARRLAVVPQEPRFDFPFTALEVVLMGRHPHLSGIAFESAADIDVARAALARAGAEALADRAIDELSTGERQRVVFARALAQATPLLVLDEPASFLDLKHQVGLFDRLRELAREGRAILAVLHDLNLAAEYCDRLALLSGGRLLAAGSTRDVLTYANLTAAYETEIYVDVNDLTGSLVVTPLSGRARERLRSTQ